MRETQWRSRNFARFPRWSDRALTVSRPTPQFNAKREAMTPATQSNLGKEAMAPPSTFTHN